MMTPSSTILNTVYFDGVKCLFEYSMNELGFDELDFDNEDQLEELNNYLEEKTSLTSSSKEMQWKRKKNVSPLR